MSGVNSTGTPVDQQKDKFATLTSTHEVLFPSQ